MDLAELTLLKLPDEAWQRVLGAESARGRSGDPFMDDWVAKHKK